MTTYQDYCLLLSIGAVIPPSDQTLDSIEDKDDNYTLVYSQTKRWSFRPILQNLTVGQFIQLSNAKDVEDFLKVLKSPVTIQDMAANDYRHVLLFNRVIARTMQGIARAMELAHLEPLPEESGLESVRDESLKHLHLLNFARTNFGYQSFADAEEHPMSEVLVLMRLQADDERFRRAYQRKIEQKHKLR